MNSCRKIRLLPLPSIFSLLLGVLVISGCQSSSSRTPAKASANTIAEPPREVRVATARTERVTRGIEATGTLAAQDEVALAMKVTGQIVELNVDLGDHVKKGQVIARLDTTDLRLQVEQSAAALQQARTRLGLSASGTDERVDPAKTPTVIQATAALNEARINRDRAQKLLDEKLIARADFDSALSAYQSAEGMYQDAIEEIRNRQAILAERKSQLKLARQQLEYGELRSPIDGAVVERSVSVGQYVTAGTTMVRIVRVDPLRLRLPVPERAASGVRVGQRAIVRADQDNNIYYGRVTRISPAIDMTNRTLMIEAEVPNAKGLLRPGAFVRAELITESNQPAVFVPTSSLVSFAGLDKVITIEDGKAVERLVKIGRKETDRVEILDGLEPGEKVVVRPGNLVGGTPVTIAQK